MTTQNPSVNYQSVGLALATAVGLLIVFVASGLIFNSSSPISKVALLIGGGAFMVGAVAPRRMLVLLVPITFFLDEAKRLLVLLGRTELDDVTSILAIAPLAAAGILVGCIIQRIFFRRKSDPVERLAIFAAIAAFVAFGGTEVFTAGNLMYSLKAAANSTVYFLLPWAVLQLCRTRQEIEQFLKYCIILGTPVALYGIWQYVVGLSDFEITYLKSGLSIGGQVNLEDVRPRPFSTLSSPHSYSNVIMFMLALTVHFMSSWKTKGRSQMGYIIAGIYAVALLLSMARTAIVAGIVMLVFGKLFRSKVGTWFAYSSALLFIGGMVLFAEPLLYSLDKLEGYLPIHSDWQGQAFRLGTWSDRLMGYRNVLANPGSWPLFANPLKFNAVDLDGGAQYSHDLFSQIILRIGIIPVFFCVCVAIYILWCTHRAIVQLPAGKGSVRPLAAQIMAIIAVFVLAQAAGSGMTVFPLNFWVGIFSGLLSVICIYLRKAKPTTAKPGEVAIAAPVPAAAS